MGSKIPSMRLFGNHTCCKCGQETDCSFSANGKTYCLLCDMKRIVNESAARSRLMIICQALFIAAITFVTCYLLSQATS